MQSLVQNYDNLIEGVCFCSNTAYTQEHVQSHLHKQSQQKPDITPICVCPFKTMADLM